MIPIDFKAAITQDIAEIDLALSVLNGLRNVNQALSHDADLGLTCIKSFRNE